jgi:hypothetical protein
MPAPRRLLAIFESATPHRAKDGAGVALHFDPQGRLPGADHIEDFAALGPDFTIPVVVGLGKVLRILRVARVATPADPRELVGCEGRAAELLERAAGTRVLLGVRPRSRIRFAAWTEGGIETVEDIAQVTEWSDAFHVMRRRGPPVRIPRESVARQQTEMERWYEVVDIERVPPPHG